MRSRTVQLDLFNVPKTCVHDWWKALVINDGVWHHITWVCRVCRLAQDDRVKIHG